MEKPGSAGGTARIFFDGGMKQNEHSGVKEIKENVFAMATTERRGERDQKKVTKTKIVGGFFSQLDDI
jgi:hypothetical protein